jgi:NADH-quinone oxidoreductase subunit J
MQFTKLVANKSITPLVEKRNPLFANTILETLFLAAILGPVLLVLLAELANFVILQGSIVVKEIYFLYVPLLACALALSVVTLRNPVYALLSLIGVFLSVITIYVISGALFLGLVFLIVYVGAVAILFLFVIMLLNVKSLVGKKEVSTQQKSAQIVAGVALLLLSPRLFVEIPNALAHTALQDTALAQQQGSAAAVITYVNQQAGDVFTFHTLYTEHSALFLLITYILLIAMLGAIILATKTHDEESSIAGPHCASH